MKNPNDLIGNQTRTLPVWIAAPQPTSSHFCTPLTPACISVPQPTAPHFVHPWLPLVSQCLNQLRHTFVHPWLRLVSQCLNQLRHTLCTPDSGLYRGASTNCATLLYTLDSGLYRSASTNCATLCTPQTPACIAVPQTTSPHFVHPCLRLVSRCLKQLRRTLCTPASGLYRGASTNCATLCTPQTRHTIDNYCRSVRYTSSGNKDTGRTLIIWG